MLVIVMQSNTEDPQSVQWYCQHKFIEHVPIIMTVTHVWIAASVGQSVGQRGGLFQNTC